jgi:hypothetical protein
MRKLIFRIGICLLLSLPFFAQQEAETQPVSLYVGKLQKLVELHNEIRSIHPLLEKLYPVAIAEDEIFFVFDVAEQGSGYSLIKTARPAMIVPKGVRAAFPLDFYDDKMACVVTGEVFDDISGYATIFHEFVHCGQMETSEPKLKARLSVAREAESNSDYMWELAHPFPYKNDSFTEIYTLFLETAASQDNAGVSRCRAFLREVLNVQDFEYMLWVEWKEGFARYIENKVLRKLELEPRRGKDQPPFDRVTFYEGGARYIAMLIQEDKNLEKDLESLFQRMLRQD